MNLFHDKDFRPTFKKLAMPVKLSDVPDNWQKEIAVEIFKQCPYLADYAVNVIIERVEPERGFAFGSAEVTHKSEMPAQAPGEPGMQIGFRVPIIVKDRMLQSLDVFLDGKEAFPLNEGRVREHMFRSDTFELSNRKPTDQGMVDQLYPPLRTNYGYGNAATTGAGLGGGGFAKLAAPSKKKESEMRFGAPSPFSSGSYSGDSGTGKEASLVEAIAPTVAESDLDVMVNSVKDDPETATLAARNEAFQKLALHLVNTPRVSLEKTAEALLLSIKPTVVQLEKLATGDFKVKWANAGAFAPQEGQVPGAQAAQMAGTDRVLQMNPGDTVTVSTDKVQKETLAEEKVEVVDDFGQYRVENADSSEQLAGWVIPIMDFEMQPLPLFLWTDGSGQYAVQDEIAGSRIGHNLNIPEDEPHDDGAFYYVDNERARALLPVTIKSTLSNQDGSIGYMVEDAFGVQSHLQVVPGLQTIEKMDETTYGIPDMLKWLPLGQPVHLVKNPAEMTSIRDAQGDAQSQAEVRSTGPGEFSMQGAPVEKVARDERTFIDRANAEFLLVGMGVNPFEARDLLKQAEKQGLVKVGGLRHIEPFSDHIQQMRKTAAAFLSEFPWGLRKNLVKEAAALEDAETADKILALNFINPENVSTFANYLPELDSTSKRLAEMLVAARLGMSEFNEGAIERGMKSLEEVIQGLRALQQKQMV